MLLIPEFKNWNFEHIKSTRPLLPSSPCGFEPFLKCRALLLTIPLSLGGNRIHPIGALTSEMGYILLLVGIMAKNIIVQYLQVLDMCAYMCMWCVCVFPPPLPVFLCKYEGSVIVKFICAIINLRFHIYCAEYTKFNFTAYIWV